MGWVLRTGTAAQPPALRPLDNASVVVLSAVLVLCLFLFACSASSPPPVPRSFEEPASVLPVRGVGELHILLTDAPLDGVDSVLVTVSQIEVRFAEAEPLELLEAPVVIDLLELRDGVTMALGVAQLPAGIIHQIRLIVDSAEIVIDGVASPLSIPSGEQSGIKLTRPGGFLIGPDATTTVIADFDAAESVHETGHGFQLRPVVRLVDVIFLQVTSPEPGQFVGTDTVDVEGIFDAMSPITSITVNGIPATLFVDTFVATGVPLNPHGTTTLTIVATDADGFTAVLALVVGTAAGLMPEAKLSVSDPVLDPLDDFARVWMISATGELLTRVVGLTTTSLLPAWRNFGAPGPVAGPGGVSAVSFECGIEVHERAYFLADDGALWEKRLIDNADAGWASLGTPPAGVMPLDDEVEAFTGRFGVAGVSPFTRRIYAAVVDEAGTLWLARNDDPCELAAPPWGWEAQGAAEPGTPLTATVRPGLLENPVFLFLHGPQGEVRRLRNSDGLWAELLPIPLGPETRCAAMDAAALDSGPHPATDVHLMCLASGGLLNGSVLTVGDGVVIANHGPPPGTTSLLRPHAIAAVATDDGVIHTGLLGEDRHLWQLRTGAELGWDDLGETPDTSDAFGGLVAFESGAFLDEEVHVVVIGQLTDAYYLAHRDLGREPGWELLGTDARVRPVLLGPDAYAETRMAEHLGKIFTGLIRRSDVDTPAEVFATWSTTDGLETGLPQQLPLFPGAEPRVYVTDPTTVVRSDGTGQITALGIGPTTPCNGLAGHDSSIWTCTTTDGTLDESNCHEIHSFPGAVLDHPWTALTSGPGGDVVHYAWWNMGTGGTGTVEYCREADDPAASIDCSTPSTLVSVAPGPPTIATDADQETVYVVWSGTDVDVHLCAVSLLDPLGECDYLVNLDDVTGLREDISDVVFGPGDDLIRALQTWSLTASPTLSGHLYYAVHVCEPDLSTPSLCAPTKDIMFTTSVDGGLTWSPPVVVNEAPEDGTDQFFPAITVATSRGDFDGDGVPDDQILLTYYDRMSTVTSVFPRSALFLRGLNQFVSHAFFHDPETPTDALSLPRNCIFDKLFIGDYHEGAGGRIHGHAVVTEAHEDLTAPNGDVWEIYFVPPGI